MSAPVTFGRRRVTPHGGAASRPMACTATESFSLPAAEQSASRLSSSDVVQLCTSTSNGGDAPQQHAAVSSDGSAAAFDDVPRPLPKLRRKPQRKRNIGPGKLYQDEAAFVADRDAWAQEHAARAAKMKERACALERQREKRRVRSGRQRNGEHETDSERRTRQRRKGCGSAGPCGPVPHPGGGCVYYV